MEAHCAARLLWRATIFVTFAGPAITATTCSLIAGFGWTSLPWLHLLLQPTLVMAGDDDPLVPLANGRILASLIPNARLATIDDGHLFLITSACQSAEIISEF